MGFIDMNDKGEQQNKTSFQWGLLKVAQISNQGYIFICICSILIQLNINHKQFEAENTNVMASKKAKLLPKHGSGIQVFAFIQSRKLPPFRYRAIKFVYAKDMSIL